VLLVDECSKSSTSSSAAKSELHYHQFS
jgi:hypothetical protein